MMGNSEKLRGLFFALIMVASVMVAGAVFSGGAVAQEATVTGGGDALQTTIDDAGDDDEIVVDDSGTYDQIVINRGDDDASGLTIRAAEGASPTISHGAGDGTPTVAIDQDGITLEGFTIKRTGSNNVAQTVRVAGDNVELTDNTYDIGSNSGDAAVGVLTDSSGAAGNPTFDGTISDVTISGGKIITEDGSQSGVLVADNGAASFEQGAVSISGTTFTANADGRKVLELDTGGGGVVDTAAVLSDNTFDTAAEVSDTNANINGFSVDGVITSSIDDAVGYAATDATVTVEDGTYPEDVKLGPDGLTLTAAEDASPTIEGQGNNDGAIFISNDHPGIEVSGLTIESAGGENAVHLSTGNEITDVTFSGNTFVGADGQPNVFVGGDHEDIDFDGNTFTSAATATKHLFLGGQASYGSGSESATGTDNADGITVNDFNSYSKNAIEFEGQHAEITGNSFSSDAADSTAIAIPGAIGGGNNVNIDGQDISVNENNFDANTNGLEVDSDVSNTLDATSNWWGNASGPDNADSTAVTDGAEVSGAVTYTPWADSEINTDSPDPSLTATAFVSGDIENYAYSDIDSAVSNPDGETINLGVETIQEAVDIDLGDSQSLELQSATDVDTTVRASDDYVTELGNPTIDIRGSGNEITLSDLTVERIAADDRSSEAGHAQGIKISDIDVTIDGVDVTGTLNTGNDYDRFDGIVVLNTGSTSSNINIQGETTVSGFYAGLVVTETGTQTGGVSVDGLTTENNNDGVVVKSHSDSAPKDLTVENSKIRNNDRHGVFIVGGSEGPNYQGYDLNGANANEVDITRSNIVTNGQNGFLADSDTVGGGNANANAKFNYWGQAPSSENGLHGPNAVSGNDVSSGVTYDPFLTKDITNLDVEDPAKTTAFANDLTIPEDTTVSVGVPGQVPDDYKLTDLTTPFDGVIEYYDGSEEEWVTIEDGSTYDVSTLEAFKISTDPGETAVANIEHDDSSGVGSVTLQQGWNFVPSPTDDSATGSEGLDLRDNDVGDTEKLYNPYTTPSNQFGTDSAGEGPATAPDEEVTPFKGYWVFINDGTKDISTQAPGGTQADEVRSKLNVGT